MRLTHFGPACQRGGSDGTRGLLVPRPLTAGMAPLTELDAILITHQHPDHVDVERLPQLLEANDAAALLAEPETAAELNRAGIEARALHPGERHTLGGLPVHATGGRHAVIHPDLPRVGNVALLLGTSRSDGGDGLLLHPGDSYDVVPADVDLLALPLWAPWAKVSETVEYLRAVHPAVAVPIHDGPLQPPARSIYLTHCTNLASEGTVLRGMEHGVATEPLG